MSTTTILIAAAEEPSRGWGGPIAILVAGALFLLFAVAHDHFYGRAGDDEEPDEALPSPTRRARGVSRDTQVNSGVDTDDTERDTDSDTGWWGQIVNVGGRRVRVTEPVDVDELDDDGDDQEPEEEPVRIEDAIAMLEDRGVPYTEIVRTVREEFEVSESTAKRRIREVRAERAATR